MEKIEERASQANDKLQSLAERIGALEGRLAGSAASAANANDDVSEPLKDHQLGMLAQLRQLRKKLNSEDDSRKPNSKKTGNKALDDDKINYRISFMLEQLADAESDKLN